jgi:hypothetical protein
METLGLVGRGILDNESYSAGKKNYIVIGSIVSFLLLLPASFLACSITTGAVMAMAVGFRPSLATGAVMLMVFPPSFSGVPNTPIQPASV